MTPAVAVGCWAWPHCRFMEILQCAEGINEDELKKAIKKSRIMFNHPDNSGVVSGAHAPPQPGAGSSSSSSSTKHHVPICAVPHSAAAHNAPAARVAGRAGGQRGEGGEVHCTAGRGHSFMHRRRLANLLTGPILMHAYRWPRARTHACLPARRRLPRCP